MLTDKAMEKLAAAHGGPAFPSMIPQQGAHESVAYKGMSLRDYFAAQALIGLLANSSAGYEPFPVGDTPAQLAYEQADAMLKAREVA